MQITLAEERRKGAWKPAPLRLPFLLSCCEARQGRMRQDGLDVIKCLNRKGGKKNRRGMVGPRA